MTKAEDQCRDYQQERRSVPVEMPDAFETPCLSGYAACRTTGVRVHGLNDRFVDVDVDQEMNASECRSFAAWLLKAAEWIEGAK